jgi:hypothetical protein
MSTILFHSSPLVVQLRLHNGASTGEGSARDSSEAVALDAALRIPEVPRVMLRRAPDRRKRVENIQQSA